jgi:hypothetical protein
MKLAWLCYEHDEDYPMGYNPDAAIVYFRDPPDWKYAKIIQIVYSEIVK